MFLFLFRVVCSLFITLLLSGTLYDIIFIQYDLKGKLAAHESSVIKSINYSSGQSTTDDCDQQKPSIPPPTQKSSELHLAFK